MDGVGVGTVGLGVNVSAGVKVWVISGGSGVGEFGDCVSNTGVSIANVGKIAPPDCAVAVKSTELK